MSFPLPQLVPKSVTLNELIVVILRYRTEIISFGGGGVVVAT